MTVNCKKSWVYSGNPNFFYWAVDSFYVIMSSVDILNGVEFLYLSSGRIKTLLISVVIVLLLVFFGLMITGKPGIVQGDYFDLTISEMLEKGKFSQFEIKVANKFPRETSISSVMVVIRNKDLGSDPEYPVKIEALPVSNADGKGNRQTYYDVKLKTGQFHRFIVRIPKTITEGTEMADVEIQVKAAATGENGRPYVIHSVRFPKVLENHT